MLLRQGSAGQRAVITGDMIWGDADLKASVPAHITAEWNAVDSALATLKVPVYRSPGNHDLAQLLRLLARNERPLIAAKNTAHEFRCPEQMLQRLARRAPPHELANRFQLPIPERPVEFEIQIHPLLSQRMRQQMLDVQPRTFDSALFKERNRRLS